MNNAPNPETNSNNMTSRTRYARLIALAFAIAFLGMAGIFAYLIITTQAMQFGVLGAIAMLVTLANAWALRLIQQQRIVLAATLMIGGMLILFPVATALVEGIGLVMGIGMALAAIMIAALVLVQPASSRAIIIGVLAGTGVLLLDIFFPFAYIRLSNPIIQLYIPVAAVVVLGAMAFLMAREFRNYSLRTKLSTAFIAIALMAVLIPGYFTNRSSSARLTRDAGEQLIQQGNTYAILVGEILAKEVAGLETIGLSKIVQDRVEFANKAYRGDAAAIQAELLRLDELWRAADAANNNADPVVFRVLNNTITTQLNEYRATFPENAEVFITDRYGANVAATNRTSDYYQADEAWWKIAYNNGNGGIYIGEPEYDASSQTYASIIAVPLYAYKSREVIGVLRTTLDLRAISTLLNSFERGETGRIEFYVSNNQRLPTSGGALVAGEPQVANLSANSFALIEYDGQPSIVSAIPVTALEDTMSLTVEELGWKVVIHQDEGESLAPVTSQTQNIILISLLILGLAGLAAFYAARVISQPVLNLTDAVKRIATGDFQARADIISQDEIGLLASTFNRMTEDLQKLVSGLEQRVAERTFDLAQASRESEQRALELRSIAEVSSTIAGEQKLEKLLPLAANLISEKFNFYHVGVFLNDATGRYAILQAANSQGGQRMLARSHKLEIGQAGLVGYVAQTGQAHIALDVGADAIFFSNPDLPETRSEIALPLNVRGETIGVLDVQSEKPGAFSQTDIDTLSVLADQVAISIDNARLFGEAQQTLAETQTLYTQYLGQQWQGFLQEEKLVGYQHTLKGGEKLETPLESDEIQQALRKGQVVVKNPRSDSAVLAVPVRLRNQVIGVLNIRAINPGQPWGPDEVNMVQAISDRLALTLETARLFQEAQRRATTERAIGEVATKLATAQDIDSILRLTAEELGKLLSNSKIAIQINPAARQMK